MALTQIKTAGIAADAVDGTKIADAAVANEHIAVDAVNPTQMAHGTDGNLITYDTNGAPGFVATGNDGQVLTSQGADSVPQFEDLPASNNYTHPNHSGEVTSTADGAQVIASNVVDEDNLKVDNSPTNDHVLTAKSSATGGLTWAAVASQDTLSFRNLVINGNMTVAQRATSYTSDQQGYRTVDRFGMEWNGADAVLEQHQVDVTNSGHTGAWEAGFRKAWKIVNGNQSSGAGAADYAQLYHKIEAFNMAYSGWDYKDTNKDITLQFWVRSSVAQNFQCALVTDDGTDKQYTFEYTISSANTWTKISKTIAGHADLEFHTKIGLGMTIYWSLFHGTDMTTSTGNLNQWANWGGNDDWKDMTSTWWTTNDAEFWVTGVQLEVGDTATTFEHMPVADNLARCQRYYYKKPMFYSACMTYTPGSGEHNFTKYGTDHPVEMRAAPSFVGGDFACWSWSSATGIAKANITYSGDHGPLASSLSVACTAANGAAPANGPGSGHMIPCRQLDSEFNAEL